MLIPVYGILTFLIVNVHCILIYFYQSVQRKLPCYVLFMMNLYLNAYGYRALSA